MMNSLTHFNTAGFAHMVDVGDKPSTRRIAVARGAILMQAETAALIAGGKARKGDVLGVARIAGIQAAKKTSDLIPLCHCLALTRVELDLELQGTTRAARVVCTSTVETVGRTGVEIEALMAVQVALLTIYDMCKAVDRSMTIDNVRLLEKQGGRSGHWSAATD